LLEVQVMEVLEVVVVVDGMEEVAEVGILEL
jgi:hypothetical protein